MTTEQKERSVLKKVIRVPRDKARVVVEKGADNLWYVRVVAANGKKIFRTGDGYHNRSDARNVLRYLHPERCVELLLDPV